MSAVEKFKRTLRNLEGMQRRGATRNAESHYRDRAAKLEALRDLVRTDDAVCDALDNDDRLAARFNRAERREVGAAV